MGLINILRCLSIQIFVNGCKICITKTSMMCRFSVGRKHFPVPSASLFGSDRNWKDFLISLIYCSSLRIVIVLNRNNEIIKKDSKRFIKVFPVNLAPAFYSVAEILCVHEVRQKYNFFFVFFLFCEKRGLNQSYKKLFCRT